MTFGVDEALAWVRLFQLQMDFRIQILSESSKNGVEMHFESDF